MLSMQIMAINWFRQVPKTVTSPLLDSEVGAVLVVLQPFFTGFRVQPGPPTSRVAQVRILHQHLIEAKVQCLGIARTSLYIYGINSCISRFEY